MKISNPYLSLNLKNFYYLKYFLKNSQFIRLNFIYLYLILYKNHIQFFIKFMNLNEVL